MLSKFFRSAKSLLKYSPNLESSRQLPEAANTDDEVMVTTRKQAGSQSTNPGSSPGTRLTRSAAKGGVEDLTETETLPVRVKDGGNATRRISVEVVIPASRLPEAVLDSKSDAPTIHEVVEIADSEESEGEADEPAVKSIEASQVYEVKDANELQRNAIQVSNSANQETGVVLREIEPSNAENVALAPINGGTEIRITGSNVPPVLSSQSILTTPTPTREKSTISKIRSPEKVSMSVPVSTPEVSSHKRFGSEEPEVEILTTEPLPVDIGDINSDDDSDDAPEEFNKESAEKVHDEQDRDASTAIEMQRAAILEKRKGHEASLRQQAENANKKRKRKEEAVANQPSSPKKAKIANLDEDLEINGDMDQPNPQKLTFSRVSDLPAFLPAEFLKDDSETITKKSLVQPKIPHRTKHISLEEDKPKDRRKGTTIYRVSDTTDMRLAPKASLNARAEKARKMHGGNRKPFSKSFFKTKPRS